MADFKKFGGFNKNRGNGGFNRRGDARPGFGDRPSFGGRDRERSEMFTATCSDCGNQCQVPFRPNGSKPVYCDNCFSAKRDGYSNDSANSGAPKHRSQQVDTFTFGAPAPKHTPSQSATSQSDKRLDELKKQVDALSAKIDKLLHIAQNGPQPKSVTPTATPKTSAPAHTATPTPPAAGKATAKKTALPATPVPKKARAKVAVKKKTAGKTK